MLNAKRASLQCVRDAFWTSTACSMGCYKVSGLLQLLMFCCQHAAPAGLLAEVFARRLN